MRIRTSIAAIFLALCLTSAYLGFADVHLKHDKLLHFGTFFIQSFLFYWIIDTSRKRCVNLTLIVCTAVGGVGSEFIQAVLPYRNFDYHDILANVSGSLLAIGICAWYHKRQTDRRRSDRYKRLHGGVSEEDNAVSELVEFDVDVEAGPDPADDDGDIGSSVLLEEVAPEPIK